MAQRFTTTQWGLVAAAAAPTNAESRAALAELCARYWYPLYAYIRHRGYLPSEAEDLTQAFFAMLLEKRTLKRADPSRGRFRSYLLGTLKHFLAGDTARARVAKRGGGRRPISLDAGDAEGRLRVDPVDRQSPDRLFDRHWALTVLNLTLTELRDQYVREGKQQLFERLQPCLAGRDPDVTYQQLATELGMTEGAVKVAMHRLRRRYGELVRRQIAHTVPSLADIDDEIRQLFTALRA